MLTKDNDSSGSSSRRAIVIGGSIAGLLAARVLTDYFDRVTIVERDSLLLRRTLLSENAFNKRDGDSSASRFPEQPVSRPGVPQSPYTHVLLTRGQRILEQLFPGLEDELARYKAPLIDWTADCALLLPNGWSPRFSSEITTRACTRNLREAVIGQRLDNYSSVEFLEATQVIGLLTNPDHTVVTGVRVKDGNGTEAELPAHFVVDASGRNSKAPKWLQGLGYGMPQETVVNSFLGYSCRMYESLNGSSSNYKALYVMPKAPDHPRGCVICQVEEGRWMVALIGVGRDYPPTDEVGFLNFAQSLRSPEIYQAIKDAKPLSPIYGYRRTENRWHHYERLSRFPENFIVVGDAVCAFNPVYGQGMSVAALGALTLDRCFKQQERRRSHQELTGLAQRFQKQLAKANNVPWLMATSDDFRWSTTEGKPPGFTTRLMHWYLDCVMQAASESAEVYRVFAAVIHLLEPPTALFHPQIVAQLVKSAMNGHSNAASPDSAAGSHLLQLPVTSDRF